MWIVVLAVAAVFAGQIVREDLIAGFALVPSELV